MWSYIQNERGEAFLGAENRIKALLRVVRRECHGRRLLNIGAGNGFLELEARRRGFNVVSVDPDEKTCMRLVSAGIDARVGLIEKIPADACTFDSVVATEVLEHLSPVSLRAGLHEIDRVLKPHGRFVGTVPYREKLEENLVVCPDCQKVFHRWGHQQSFTVETLTGVLAGYFEVEACRPVIYPPWNILNWKGKTEAWLGVLLSPFGIYGARANILFVCRKRVEAWQESRHGEAVPAARWH
jgi:SAM-dependent methyltransferase